VNAIFCFTAVYFNIKNRPHHTISKEEAKVQKAKIFTLISKMATYSNDKMHTQKVLAKKQIFYRDFFSGNIYKANIFLGCFLSLRYVDIFEISIK
jgi:hypothetical protein